MASKVYTTQPARRILPPASSPNFVAELQQALDDLHNATLPFKRANNAFTITYGTTVTPNLALGNIQLVSVTDGNSFKVAAPMGVSDNLSKYGQVQPTALWTLIITHANGQESLGTITFNSAFQIQNFTNPSPGQSATANFVTVISGKTVTHYQVGSWSTR